MTREFELSEQLHSPSTRRAAVATGVKLAYAAPIVAASFKVSMSNALAISPVDNCFHSSGTNGGCMPACTSVLGTGNLCNDICGNGQTTGACPVGTGGGNPCCNPGYCVPANYDAVTGTYTGPTSGCPPVTTTGKKKKK
jgi:hypothetical protein